MAGMLFLGVAGEECNVLNGGGLVIFEMYDGYSSVFSSKNGYKIN